MQKEIQGRLFVLSIQVPLLDWVRAGLLAKIQFMVVERWHPRTKYSVGLRRSEDLGKARADVTQASKHRSKQ